MVVTNEHVAQIIMRSGRRKRFRWSRFRFEWGNKRVLLGGGKTEFCWEWDTADSSMLIDAVRQVRESWTSVCRNGALSIHAGELSLTIRDHINLRLKKIARDMETAPWPISDQTIEEAVASENRRWRALFCDIQGLPASLPTTTAEIVMQVLYNLAIEAPKVRDD